MGTGAETATTGRSASARRHGDGNCVLSPDGQLRASARFFKRRRRAATAAPTCASCSAWPATRQPACRRRAPIR